jgi:ribonuclease P protein component
MRLSRAHFATSSAAASHGPEKRLASAHFSLSVRETKKGGGCAVIVSKKVAKLSVTRHLLKRRVLAVVRTHCLPGRIVMIYARPGAPSLDFPALEAELQDLLHRSFPKTA